MSTPLLVYECPHCRQAVEVDETSIGKTVHCPHDGCGRPFEVDAPRARRMDASEVPKARVKSLSSHRTIESDAVGSGAEETVAVVHPAMFRAQPLKFLGLLLLVGLGIAGLVTAGLGDEAWGAVQGDGTIMLVASGTAIAVGAVWLGIWWLQTRYVTLRITTERSLLREGIISRQTSEVRHRDVRNLQVDQNIIERILGVGNVAISSAGQDEMEIFVKGVPHPERVSNHVRELQ